MVFGPLIDEVAIVRALPRTQEFEHQLGRADGDLLG